MGVPPFKETPIWIHLEQPFWISKISIHLPNPSLLQAWIWYFSFNKSQIRCSMYGLFLPTLGETWPHSKVKWLGKYSHPIDHLGICCFSHGSGSATCGMVSLKSRALRFREWRHSCGWNIFRHLPTSQVQRIFFLFKTGEVSPTWHVRTL